MEKYKHYTATDFSQEESFIRWVKGIEQENDPPWDQWVSEHPDKDKEVALAKQLVATLQFKTEQVTPQSLERVWNKIDTATEVQNPNASRRSVIKWLSYAAAAAVVATVLIVQLGDPYDTHINTRIAENQNIELPDGSMVRINADSKLAYDQKSWSTSRTLKLDGEAFFEVQKGSTFSVQTDYGVIEVLGTSFNVYARNSELHVTCETGKVSVATDQNKTILEPAQAVYITKGMHDLQTSVPKNGSRSQWTSGIYMYKEVPLYTVIQELKRQFNIEIKSNKDVQDIMYSGSFTTVNEETALQEVLWPLDLKYRKSGNVVSISN